MHRKNKIKKTQLQYRQPYTLYLSLNVFVDKKQGHRAVYIYILYIVLIDECGCR